MSAVRPVRLRECNLPGRRAAPGGAQRSAPPAAQGVPRWAATLPPERLAELQRIVAEEEALGPPVVAAAAAAEPEPASRRAELVEVVARVVQLGLAPVVEEAAAELAELLGRETSVAAFVLEAVRERLQRVEPG